MVIYAEKQAIVVRMVREMEGMGQRSRRMLGKGKRIDSDFIFEKSKSQKRLSLTSL